MIDGTKPWKDMSNATKRRVNVTSKHDIYWFMDIEGRYGIYIKSKDEFNDCKIDINLKGILIIKQNAESNGELYLILLDKEDWAIFYSLCQDLIAITDKISSSEAMVQSVEERLRRWQKLLRTKINDILSIERQMGLVSELSCLTNIIEPPKGITQAITYWVGADFDKQDFLLDDMAIEVKSYKTSKAPLVTISSKYQLFSEKEPIFLIVYSLTPADSGIGIKELVDDIYIMLDGESQEIKDIFETKLYEYGYNLGHVEHYSKFVIDKCRIYAVTDQFPKISPQILSPQIYNVTYDIDLSTCGDYEISNDQLFN